MPKKVHKLEEKEDYEFGLIGIASPENDYRISWILNTEFGLQLNRKDDLELYHKKLEGSQAFHQFGYHDEETLRHYRLLSNKCENGYILEELSNIDYLIQISGDVQASYMDILVKKLNALPGITFAFRIEPGTLKSRKRLLT